MLVQYIMKWSQLNQLSKLTPTPKRPIFVELLNFNILH